MTPLAKRIAEALQSTVVDITSDLEDEILAAATEPMLITDIQRDGSWWLVGGPSGYSITPMRWALCQWHGYHNRPGGYWRQPCGTDFTESGPDATHCLYPPSQVQS